VAPVLFALVAVACSGGSDGTMKPPMVDVSGQWIGDWAEPEQPLQPSEGEVSLQFVQDEDGIVTGSASVSNLGCGTTATFRGALLDLVLTGKATEPPDFELRFSMDAEQAERGASGTMTGTFILVSGTGCPASFEGAFLVTGVLPE